MEADQHRQTNRPAAANPQALPRQSKTNIQYTDVVIIGNGPSGITLSFLLSGHWPYYSGAPLSDEYLQMRLESCQKDLSIVDQDLEFLSDGLEGRSSNPVALLFDALTHPDADMGMENDSVLQWRHRKDRVIPHVVLGKSAEGGIWQMLDGKVHTLSLGRWMELPAMPFKQWLSQYRSNHPVDMSGCPSDRASMDEVKHYYMDYVSSKNLTQYFANYSVVTSVERVLDVCHCVDAESGEQAPCSRDHSGKFKWEVRGYRTTSDPATGRACTEEFYYRAPNVVLATGTFDKPNRLSVAGEQSACILHSIAELEHKMADELTPQSDPVLVVGAGLSAADAILCALSRGIPVVHIFRRPANDPQIVYQQLPTALYPEYHKVHAMMQAEESHGGLYRALPASCVKQFLSDGKVCVHSLSTGCDSILKTSCVVILIGSRPNLSFLPGDGRTLGRVPGMDIDSKHNPIEVNPFTHQSTREPGLFALGPLTGDNFVRFLRGGALGITAHLWQLRQGLL